MSSRSCGQIELFARDLVHFVGIPLHLGHEGAVLPLLVVPITGEDAGTLLLAPTAIKSSPPEESACFTPANIIQIPRHHQKKLSRAYVFNRIYGTYGFVEQRLY